MPRILGIDIPKDRPIYISLTHVYGIGVNLARKICKDAGIEPQIRAKDLTDADVSKLTAAIQKGNYKTEGDLRREVAANIKRLISIGCYRGNRHKRGLPVRGQRTHTNARTRKGPRRMPGKTRPAAAAPAAATK